MGAVDIFLAFPLDGAVVDVSRRSDVADKDQRCCVQLSLTVLFFCEKLNLKKFCTRKRNYH